MTRIASVLLCVWILSGAGSAETVPGLQTVEAGCISGGYTSYTDAETGVVTILEQMPMLGHDFGDWSDCGDRQKRVCSRCGEEEEIMYTELPAIRLYGSMGGISKEHVVCLRVEYEDGERSFSCYAFLSLQGHATLNLEKKNYMLRLYDDEAHEDKHQLYLNGWHREHKFVLKADLDDPTLCRNLIAARVWSDMVSSRENVDPRLMSTSNHGAVDGFPVTLWLNDTFLGLYTMNLHKDNDLYDIVINGQTFVNDPISYQSITIPSGSASMLALDENGIKGIGLGRAVFTVQTLDGQSYNFIATVTDSLHLKKTHFDRVEPTCTEAGSIDYDRCDICGKLFDEDGVETAESSLTILPIGHNVAADAGYPATCTEDGLSDGSHCTVCLEVLQEQTVIPALTHDLVHHDAKPATSTEIGWYEYDTCSRCDYSTYREIPMRTAETVTIPDLKFGEAASELAMAGQPITATINGTSYSFDDFPGTFKNEIRMNGGNTCAVTEVTVPSGKITADDSDLYLGTMKIYDCFGEGAGTLRILSGNRETGVYAASAEIPLTGAYQEGIYLPRDAENAPVLVDRIYLLTYTMDGEIVHSAMSLYIDYEDYEAEHESLETSLTHINDEPAPVIDYTDDSHSETYNRIADALRMNDYLDYDLIFVALEEGETYQDLADLFADYGKTFPRSITPATDLNRPITSLGSCVQISGLNYGDEAMQLFMNGEPNEFELGGRVYSLSDWGGSFEGKIDLYGGNTLSVVEVTVPGSTKVEPNMLIGTYTLDVNDSTALYILEGSRVTGEYNVQGPVILTHSYSENLYATQVNGVNCPTDRIYLSVTEQDGMMRCRAMSVYIDYENAEDESIEDWEGLTMFLPAALREICDEAFMNTAAGRIVVPEGVQSIGARAFADSAVKILELPDSLKSVDLSAVEGCSELKAIVCSPDNALVLTLAEQWGVSVIYR